MIKNNTGSLVRVFRGHLRGIHHVHEMPNGDLLTIGDDRTLRIWDRAGGNHKLLHAHVSWRQISITPSGIIFAFAFPSNHQHALYVWDEHYNLIRYLEKDSDNNWGDAILALTSGYVLTLSDNGDMRMWYPHGAIYRVMKGHTGTTYVTELHNGEILSWGIGTYGGYSPDKTIRLWSADGLPIREFDHHPTNALWVIQLQNGNLVSYNYVSDEERYDQTLKPIFIWDLNEQFFKVIPSHYYHVVGIQALKDGRFISMGYDNMLHLRDETGQLLGIMKQHTYGISLLELQKGRILAWAENYQLNIWQLPPVDVPILDETRLIQSFVHLDDGGKWVYLHSVIELPDGRIVTCGSDNIINVWQLPDEIKTGSVIRPIKRLVGHVGEVNRLVLLRDGSFVSCGQDGTMCLWRL